MKIVHASDLHLGPPYVPEVADAFVRKVEEIDPDLIVISGDLTQRAKKKQFIEASQLLERLPAKTLCIPGNHDIPLYRLLERFFRPYKHYTEYINPNLDVTYHHEDITLVGLNTTRPLKTITNGRISSAQLSICREAFAQAQPGALRCVFMHHNLIPFRGESSSHAIPNGAALLETFVSMNVDLILHGHMHYASVQNSLDLYPGSNRERGVILIQSGTTTSRRGRYEERKKNSFHLIERNAGELSVRSFMYFSNSDSFTVSKEVLFPTNG